MNKSIEKDLNAYYNTRALFKMSCDFRDKVQSLKSYKDRMCYYSSYFKKWYSLVESYSKKNSYPSFDKNAAKFFKNSMEKSIFLASPSDSEVSYFSKHFKKIYFISFPKRDKKFPSNVTQLSYDKDFNISASSYILKKIDYAFSHAVVEHIHKKDILFHFKQVSSLLRDGGEYVVVCPSSIRIRQDEFSKDMKREMSANHHIGRYSYNSIASVAKRGGFKKFYKPIFNPFILNFFYKYNKCMIYVVLDKLWRYIPEFVLSALAMNSLYVKMVK